MNTDLPDKALEAFTELIIEQMENLSSNWEQPWINAQMKGLPENLTGRRYSGVNAFLLFLLCAKQRYTIPCFLTFAQAKAEGLMIKKGSRSFPVVYYNFIVKEIGSRNKISFEDYKKLSKDEQDNYHVTAYMKNYNVFNVSQTNIQEEKPQLWEELLAKFTGPAQTFDVNEMVQCKELDTLIAKQGWLCKIFPEPGNDACYIPSLDEIHIPEKKQFKNGEAFYGTLLHEMTHSTGIESRLNRNMSGSFESNQYGREELVAELTAALTLCSMGITTGPKEENMRYIKGWCENIKENPRYLMTILSDVSKANSLIHQEIEKIDLSLKKTEQVRIFDQSSDITLTHIETRQSFHFSDSNIFVEKDKNQICIAVPIASAEDLLNAARMMTDGSRLIRSEKSALNPDTKLTELIISPIDAFPFILDEKKIERQEIPLSLSTDNEETTNSIEQENHLSDNTHPLLINPTLKDGEMCHLQRVFEQTGTLSFTGSNRIQGCEDVAWIFRMLENSAVENSFVVYVTEEKAVVQHLSIGTFTEAHVPMQPIIAAVEKLKPSQLYLVHNHPSGNLNVSTPDKMMIACLIKTFDNIDVCGIIINQTSGKYVLFTDFVDEKLEFTKEPDEHVEIPVFSFSRLVFEKDYTPDKLEEIRSSADVAKFVSSHRLGERDKLNIIVLDSSLKITANIFSDFTSATTQNAEQIAKEAVNATILFGGHSYILNSNMMIPAETCKAISDYSKKFSGNSIEPSDMIFEVSSNSYVSASDEYILHDDIYSYKYSTSPPEEKNKKTCLSPDAKQPEEIRTEDRIFESIKDAINIGIPIMTAPFDDKNIESFREFASEYGISAIDVMRVYESRKNELESHFNSILKSLTNHGDKANILNTNNMDNLKKVDESQINWDELKSKFGITKEMLEEKGVLKDMFYFKKSSELLTVSYETANGLKQFDARVQFTEKDKSYSLRFYPVKENLDLSKPYMGYTFTDEDQKNMLEIGNLGKVATIKTYGDVEKEAYLSVDPLTKEVVHVLKDYIKIKDEINGVPLTGDLKNQILDGKAVFLEGMKSTKGNTFDAYVQIDANRHGIGFSWPKPELIENIFDIHQIKGVPIDNTIQTKLAHGEKIEMTGLERRTGGTFNAVVSFDPESKKLKFDFLMQSQAMNPNEIFIPNRLKGVTLSDKQKISISNGEKVLVQGMKSAKGPTYDAYVFINKKEGKLDMEFPVKSEFLGVKFSPEQMDKMQAGNAVWVSGLRKKGGETFKAPVLWNAKTGKFEFQQLKKSEAVAPASPSPAPTKEKKEKQEDKPEEKSQKQKNPKVTNEDNGKKKGRKI